MMPVNSPHATAKLTRSSACVTLPVVLAPLGAVALAESAHLHHRRRADVPCIHIQLPLLVLLLLPGYEPLLTAPCSTPCGFLTHLAAALRYEEADYRARPHVSYWQARKRKGFDDDRRIRHGGDALARQAHPAGGRRARAGRHGGHHLARRGVRLRRHREFQRRSALLDRGAQAPPRARVPAVRARRDDARHGRLRAARTHPSAARAHLDARAVPHGERRAFRSRVGTHVGRRRLHREAVSAPRAGAAHRRRAAPLLCARTRCWSWLRAA